MRRGWWTTLLLDLGMMLFALAPAFGGRLFLREADAQHTMFPEGTGSVRKTLDLSPGELAALEKALGRRIETRTYPYLEVHTTKSVIGVIFLVDVLGQSLPITFAVGVTMDGALKDIEVMVYREPRGEEIQEGRFRKQFVGKRLTDYIVLGKDIDAISGASISSRSATYAARKALSLAGILFGRIRAKEKQ